MTASASAAATTSTMPIPQLKVRSISVVPDLEPPASQPKTGGGVQLADGDETTSSVDLSARLLALALVPFNQRQATLLVVVLGQRQIGGNQARHGLDQVQLPAQRRPSDQFFGS